MTKSRGIMRPRWVWTQAQITLMTEKYPITSNTHLALMIGCTVPQIIRKAKALGLQKSGISTLTGRSLSHEHRESIQQGLLRAHKEGRLKPPPQATIQAMREGARRPEVVAKRAQLASATMKGRPQRMETLSAAAEHNARAKIYTVLTPDRVTLTFKNLSHFVRQNTHLFADSDVVWHPPESHPWCRAQRGLYSLFQESNPASEWKGWRAVKKNDPSNRAA